VWDVKTGGMLGLLCLDAAIPTLSWNRDAIALGSGTSVVLLDIVKHK
jgi:hypothetical protein